MDSPRFYDLSPGTPEKAKLKFAHPHHNQVSFGSELCDDTEFTDLDSKEVSFDLNSLICDSAPNTTALIADYLGGGEPKDSAPGLATPSGPQHFRAPATVLAHSGGYSSAPGTLNTATAPPSYTTLHIKQERSEGQGDESHRHSQLTTGGSLLSAGYSDYLPVSTVTAVPQSPHSALSSPGKSPSSAHIRSKKQADKGSEEYRKRRERNNIAVRKSREKAKIRSRHTEERVSELMKENESLHKRLELLTKELNVLRSLFNNVGGTLHDDEIAKSLAVATSVSSHDGLAHSSGHYRMSEQ